MPVNGPKTKFTVYDPGSGNYQDLGDRYVSKSYLIDVYPNIQIPGRVTPRVWGCGYNYYGQLGIGNILSYSSPIQVGALTNWKQISCGINHMAGIRNDGTWWTCGNNVFGALGASRPLLVMYSSPIQVGALTTWRQISSRSNCTLIIDNSNKLWACGYSLYGALGNGFTGSNMVYSSPVQIGTLSNWKLVSCGYNHTGAIKTDNFLWAWGANNYGQCGNGFTGSNMTYSSPIQVGSLSNWRQVACGYYHTIVVDNANKLWGFGNNANGQLGNGSTSHYSSPIQIGALTNWKQVAAGYQYSMMVKTDGTLWGCGYNNYGQLGNNNILSYSSPIQVGTLTNWKTVTCGKNLTLAIKTDGTLWGCGYNNYGQLGNNNILSYSSPIQVGALTNWKSVNAAALSAYAISDGYI